MAAKPWYCVKVPTELLYPAAFFIGLTGGVHCIGMCGSLVSAFTLGIPSVPGHCWRTHTSLLLAYNLGRIASYSIAGMCAGGLGSWAIQYLMTEHAQTSLHLLAGLFMILLGLYLAGWSNMLSRLEQVGGLLWRHIEPLGRRWLPVRTPYQALAIGLVWGWLPCGLVYSVLVWAVSIGSAWQGGLLLCSFGLGTLPTLLAIGTVAARLTDQMRRFTLRTVAGVLVFLFGIGQIIRAFS